MTDHPNRIEEISLEGEEWRDIPGFPGYLVSSFGRVWSSYKKILRSQHIHPMGYYQVSLQVVTSTGRKMVTKRIHKLVALAFMENPIGLVVDHIDNNSLNNNLSNLRYITHAQNIRRNSNRVRRDNKLGVRGVVWNSTIQKYICQFTPNKKPQYRYFKTLEEAKKWSEEIRKEWT